MALGDIFGEGVLGQRGKNLVSIYRLQKEWVDVVGEGLARSSYPKRVDGQTLVVSVENPSWSHHLSMMSDEILKVIRERSGMDVKKIRFQNEAEIRRMHQS